MPVPLYDAGRRGMEGPSPARPTQRSSSTRLSRRFYVALVAVLVALVLPLTANAWYSMYVQNQTLQPLGFKYSGFNSGLNYNAVSWNVHLASFDLTLCNSGGSCYPYSSGSGGFYSDFRSISYGRAKCHWPYSNQTVYVFYCETSN